ASDCTILEMMGRLAPGRKLADAAAELPTLIPAAWANAPVGGNSGIRVSQPRGATTNPFEIKLVRILVGVAVVLLLVCCANLAGLLNAQSAARAGEFGIRLSLGATSSRLIRQLMTESLMLAIGGGVVGLLLSRGFITALQTMFYAMDDEGHPLRYDFGLTPGVILTGISASVIAGCLFSLIPTLKAVRRNAGSSHTGPAAARWSTGSWLSRR